MPNTCTGHKQEVTGMEPRRASSQVEAFLAPCFREGDRETQVTFIVLGALGNVEIIAAIV